MGPVAQPVFKTGEVWQPHAGSVRLRGRSVAQFPADSATSISSEPGRPIFDRAIERQNLMLAESSAGQMERISLVESFDVIGRVSSAVE
jgi:hypothetical protein